MAKYFKSLAASKTKVSREDMSSIAETSTRRSQESRNTKQQLKDHLEKPNDREDSGRQGVGSGCVLLLNGYPGVGKTTIAKALQAALPSHVPSRLVDRHAILQYCEILNPTRHPEPDDYIWMGVFKGLTYSYLEQQTIVIRTETLLEGMEHHSREIGDGVLAWKRGVPLFIVNLYCDPETNEERLCSEERKAKKTSGSKILVDAKELHRIRNSSPYFDLKTVKYPPPCHLKEAYCLDLDISEASVEDSVEEILYLLTRRFE